MARRLVLLIVALTLVAACSKEQDLPADPNAPTGPLPDVELPPVPQLHVDRPMRFPDDSISIWNLMQNRSQYLGQPVRVTAYAKEIYICPFRDQQAARDRLIRYRNYLTEDEMAELEAIAERGIDPETGEPLPPAPEPVAPPPGEGEGSGEAERCLYPHLYAADSMESEDAIIVTGYGLPLEERMVVGERYLFEGRLLEETRGFNAAGRGLIYVRSITGGSLDVPVEGQEEGLQVQ